MKSPRLFALLACLMLASCGAPQPKPLVVDARPSAAPGAPKPNEAPSPAATETTHANGSEEGGGCELVFPSEGMWFVERTRGEVRFPEARPSYFGMMAGPQESETRYSLLGVTNHRITALETRNPADAVIVTYQTTPSGEILIQMLEPSSRAVQYEHTDPESPAFDRAGGIAGAIQASRPLRQGVPLPDLAEIVHINVAEAIANPLTSSKLVVSYEREQSEPWGKIDVFKVGFQAELELYAGGHGWIEEVDLAGSLIVRAEDSAFIELMLSGPVVAQETASTGTGHAPVWDKLGGTRDLRITRDCFRTGVVGRH